MPLCITLVSHVVFHSLNEMGSVLMFSDPFWIDWSVSNVTLMVAV